MQRHILQSLSERKKEARFIIYAVVAFHIHFLTNPRECWIYLPNRFAPNTPNREFEFRSRLLKLRTKESERLVNFFDRGNDVLVHLEDLGRGAGRATAGVDVGACASS